MDSSNLSQQLIGNTLFIESITVFSLIFYFNELLYFTELYFLIQKCLSVGPLKETYSVSNN